jgi:hypothetical protein
MKKNAGNKKWSIIILLLLAIVILAGLWCLFFRIDRKLIGDAIVLRRATVEGQLTENAYVSIPYTKDSSKYTFINIAIDLNKDGKFDAYQLEDGRQQEEWIVHDYNSRVYVEEGGSYSFALPDLAADGRFDFPIVIMLSKKSAYGEYSGWWWGGIQRSSAAKETIIPAIERDEVRPRFSPDPDGLGTGGLAHFFAKSANAEEPPAETIPQSPPQADLDRRDTARRINDATLTDTEGTGSGTEPVLTPEADPARIAPDSTNFNVFHPRVPDLLQGPNECVPMSTANSLLWLAKENNFEDKMPATQAELIQELKTAFIWNARSGVNVPRHFLDGKHAIVERRELPIETHQVGGRFDNQIIAKIAEELRKGQDVEVEFEYGVYDGPGYTNWRRTGGHMVTAVGASTAAGATLLDIHDPLSPGPRLLDIYRVDGTRVINYRYQGRSTTYIRYAIAESPSITRTTQRRLTDTAPTSTGTGEGGVTLTGGPFSFEHRIGGTRCPTPIGVINIVAAPMIAWEIARSTVPGWLSISESSGTGNAEVNLNFNCNLSSYTTQDLNADIQVTATDASSSPQTVNVSGHIEQ